MHKDYAREYFSQQLSEVLDDPILKNRNAEIREGEDMSFTLTLRTKDSCITPVLRFDCRNFDLEPLLVEFVDPLTGLKLADQWWPGTVQDHQLYGRAICLQETAGYHFHQVHVQDSFDNYRNGFSLLRLVRALVERIDRWGFPRGGPYG